MKATVPEVPAILVFFLALLLLPAALCGADIDELKVKREANFAFVQKPAVTRAGDRTTIAFETAGHCDVTVAIENPDGKIVRHLVSGVLGPNAPAPLQKDAKKQSLVWDGKDDQGKYIDDKESMTVRVSLGLKPQFERNLLWSPKKRIGTEACIVAAAPEGVYVFDGLGVDYIRLFDHQGNYVRTVYPFPADQLDKVVGLELHEYPHDGRKLPVKHGFVQGSLLSSGSSGNDNMTKHHGGVGAAAMAVCGNRMAVADHYLNRLGTDGSSGGLPLKGPKVSFEKRIGDETYTVGPISAAFSPDGRYVYLTGYHWQQTYPGGAGSWHGVHRLEYEKDDPPKVFLGTMTEDGFGEDNEHFMVPTSVAVDSQGRVYVSDMMNDRVQIFSPEGKFLKTIPTDKPAKVLVHPKTGEIYVFSWPEKGVSSDVHRKAKKQVDWRDFPQTLSRFNAFDNPALIEKGPIPGVKVDQGGMVSFGTLMHVTLDAWAEKPSLWMAGRKHKVTAFEVGYWGGGTIAREASDNWSGDGVVIYAQEEKKWAKKADFSAEVEKKFLRSKPPDFGRQRLFFNPANEKLYVAEDSSFGKSFADMLQVDPKSGKVKIVPLPFDAEDMCFDPNGAAYLRTDTEVVRYDSTSWREIPWDYGEERPHLQFSSIGGGKDNKAVGALPNPGARPVCWHQGGMSVSARGHLAMSCVSRAEPASKQVGVKARVGDIEGKPYMPELWPGRARWQELHIWDAHGKLVYEDAAPGTTLLCGTAVDNDDNLYILADSTRAYDGKKYFNEMTGTLMKFKPRKGRIVSQSRGPVPLSPEAAPKRPVDVAGGFTGAGWVEGADWMFGAAGWFGFNTARVGGGCDCWHSRFCLDYLNRSFVPETERYSVAVLDSNGNVIVRIGQYGNVDDGVGLVKEDAAPNAKSLAAAGRGDAPCDEVGLIHPAYVGVQTDRRLFIHDAGNSRIASVKLNYHTDEKVALKDVKDAAKK
jgi:hypothetical protein